MAQRNLTLTEELEKLEQQITLTLQEIDSNFSQAHRIVTSSILPIIEDHAKHSNAVWEGSKFWKQFFEASANVSLTGYEEPGEEEDEVTQTETSASFQTPTRTEGDSTVTASEILAAEDEEFSIDSPTQVTGVTSTPRLPPSTSKTSGSIKQSQTVRSAAHARSPSPRKYTGHNPRALETSSDQPSTPRMNSVIDLASSPFEPESGFKPAASSRKQNNDPLMHRVLDKNYRIQATPHTQRRAQQSRTVGTIPATATKKPWDDSPGSSPVIAAPQLRSEIFASAKKPLQRTPGVSVLTPAGKRGAPAPAPTTSIGRKLFSPQDKGYIAARDQTRASNLFFDDSDEDDDLLELSPPKTMQFHVPQSRLVQTPAREASKKIVEDLLLTAGADATDDIEGDELIFDTPSPSIVKRAFDIDDDTF